MKLLLNSTAIGLLSSVALAADMPSYDPAPVMAPVPANYTYNWTGLYLGLQGGYGWGDVDGEASVDADPATGPYEYDIDGFLGGVHAGYNQQFGMFVLGAEADVEYSGIEGDGTGTDPSLPGTFYHETDIDWLASFRLRGGLAWDRFLVYATGGAAWAGVSQEFGEAGDPPVADNDDDRWGWTAGGGVEMAFTENWTGRSEYRYYDLGDSEVSGAGFSDDNDITFHSVRLGTSYKF